MHITCLKPLGKHATASKPLLQINGEDEQKTNTRGNDIPNSAGDIHRGAVACTLSQGVQCNMGFIKKASAGQRRHCNDADVKGRRQNLLR